MDIATKARLRIPPYVSYRTFMNFLEELRARGLPSRIDRSVMAHKSGTVQSQLLLALQYLGLVKESDRPEERLKRLLETEGPARKKVLREMVESSYRFVFAEEFDLRSATSTQAEELFEKTGASGETVRRSLAFFLSLAKAAGISVSPYIRPHRRHRKAAQKREEEKPAALPAKSPSGAETRQIVFRSGGTVTLSLAVDLFRLERSDRKFVFDLVDRLRQYEEERDMHLSP